MGIGFLLAIVMFFVWAGIKGFISFLVGMAMMAFLLLTGNTTLLFMVKAIRGDMSLVKILKGETENEEEDEYIEVGNN